MSRRTLSGLAAVLATLSIPSLATPADTPVPLNLPRPDGKPGDPARPVKVYILAGQSNMVGMGDIAGARPPYPGVILSADPGAKVVPAAKVNFPAGMENWFAPDFEARKAGWKSGAAPFGERSDNLELPDWLKDRVGKRAPATLCENDVLLLRQSIDLPPLKEGHRYRIRDGREEAGHAQGASA